MDYACKHPVAAEGFKFAAIKTGQMVLDVASLGGGGIVNGAVETGEGVVAAEEAVEAETEDLELQPHHIVEQHAPNTLRFGEDAIQDESNIADVEASFNRALNKFYSSKNERLTGEGFSSVRQWMNTKDYDEQYELGTSIMYYLMFGGSLP